MIFRLPTLSARGRLAAYGQHCSIVLYFAEISEAYTRSTRTEHVMHVCGPAA